MKEEKMLLIMKYTVFFNLAWQWRYLTDKTGFLFIGTHCIMKIWNLNFRNFHWNNSGTVGMNMKVSWWYHRLTISHVFCSKKRRKSHISCSYDIPILANMGVDRGGGGGNGGIYPPIFEVGDGLYYITHLRPPPPPPPIFHDWMS